jgi:hypothetical protein
MAQARRAGSSLRKKSAADEHGFRAKRHAQRRVGRSGNSTGGKRRHRHAAFTRDLRHEIERRAELLSFLEHFLGGKRLKPADLCANLAQVFDGLDDISSACLALSADHSRSFSDPA